MRSKIYTFILIIVLANILPLHVFAAEKEIKLNLEKDYEIALFTLEFEEEGTYSAILSNGSKEYKFEVEDKNTLSCKVNDCKKGNWIIEITDGNEGNSQLCKVTASVKTKVNTESEAVDDIKIGKEIAGLKVYVKDTSVVAEWSDESCGNVIVSVQDILTNRVIDESTVQNKYYSCKVPENVENVIISCVPATSKGIKDAVVTFYLSMENNPDVNIIFGNGTGFVNEENYNILIDSGNSYLVRTYVDEVLADNSEIMPGENNILVPLQIEGKNEVIVEIINHENGYVKTYTNEVYYDITAPKLVMNKEYDGYSTYDENITVSGYVSDYEKLFVNDISISDVKTDGYFEYVCTLHDGNNDLYLKAIDSAGNETVYTITVTKEVKKALNISVKDIMLYSICALIVIGILLIKKKKDNKNVKAKKDMSQVSPMDALEDALEYVENVNMSKKIGTNKKGKSSKIILELIKSKRKIDMKILRKHKNLIFVIAWFIAIYLLFNFVIIPGIVPSTSMSPALKKEDFIIINGLAYKGEKTPQRGDIISFYSEEYDTKMVKRVIALPGEIVSFKDGDMYINDMLCDESAYLENDIETNCMKSFKVPDNSYFVLGDNRENSKDSRFWENPFIEENTIHGEVISAISFPWN